MCTLYMYMYIHVHDALFVHTYCFVFFYYIYSDIRVSYKYHRHWINVALLGKGCQNYLHVGHAPQAMCGCETLQMSGFLVWENQTVPRLWKAEIVYYISFFLFWCIVQCKWDKWFRVLVATCGQRYPNSFIASNTDPINRLIVIGSEKRSISCKTLNSWHFSSYNHSKA